MADLKDWQAHFERVEPEIRAFVEEEDRFARVRSEAKDLKIALAGGPEAAAGTTPASPSLAGLLLGVKDIFHVEGFPTQAGSRLPEEELEGDEGPAVGALLMAGCLVAGKTVTTEFAYFSPGPTRNPAAWALGIEATPGGSSSGSAAAVAAGLCDVALGTQTIGSVGRPAAFCGVVGFKPSYDRISRQGLIALAPSVDHVGLFARDVETVARAAAVVIPDWRAAPIDGDPRTAQSARPRLGIPRGPYLDLLSPEAREHFFRVTGELEKRSGWGIQEVEVMPDFAAIVDRHRLLVAAECAEVHRDWFARFESLYAPKTAELIRRGQGVSSSDLAAARDGRAGLRAHLESAMAAAGVEFWLSPPALGTAPLGLESTGDPIMNLPWSHSGLPAIVVPAGKAASGLPLGLQISGRFGADEELMAVARLLEGDLA
jgi:Asp-tRNA(Asn)/Glu-tRNA(Gln) amidotransferase A subunit family amidase